MNLVWYYLSVSAIVWFVFWYDHVCLLYSCLCDLTNDYLLLQEVMIVITYDCGCIIGLQLLPLLLQWFIRDLVNTYCYNLVHHGLYNFDDCFYLKQYEYNDCNKPLKICGLYVSPLLLQCCTKIATIWATKLHQWIVSYDVLTQQVVTTNMWLMKIIVVTNRFTLFNKNSNIPVKMVSQ